jgi:hypothetical protein
MTSAVLQPGAGGKPPGPPGTELPLFRPLNSDPTVAQNIASGSGSGLLLNSMTLWIRIQRQEEKCKVLVPFSKFVVNFKFCFYNLGKTLSTLVLLWIRIRIELNFWIHSPVVLKIVKFGRKIWAGRYL